MKAATTFLHWPPQLRWHTDRAKTGGDEAAWNSSTGMIKTGGEIQARRQSANRNGV